MSAVRTILCFGDSNTYGYIPGSGGRYEAGQRWPRRLEMLLGEGHEVLEEGLNGRTIAFTDNIEPYRCGSDHILPCILSHAPVDLLIVMLGTNDTKDRYHVKAEEIGYGLEELILKVLSCRQLQDRPPQILILSPVPLGSMDGCIEFSEASRQKSLRLPAVYAQTAKDLGCHFFEAGSVVPQPGCDNIHLAPEAHDALARALAPLVRQILDQSGR